MTKMMTTEPSVILKLKKGGHVESKREEMGEHGHSPMSKGNSLMVAIAVGKGKKGAPDGASPKKPSMSERRKAMAAPVMKKGGKADGGVIGAPMAPAAMPVPAVRRPVPMRRPMMAPPPVAPAGMPAGMPARAAMKKGGSTDAAQDKAMIKKAFKQHDSQEHKGAKGTKLALKGGTIEGNAGSFVNTKMVDGDKNDSAKGTKGVRTGNAGGFKAGGTIEGNAKSFVNTKVVDGDKNDPAKGTGGVRMANAGGFKDGGCVVDTTKPGVTGTSTGSVRNGNAGGFKTGGTAKKAYATGGSVNDTGRPVAMPKHSVSKPVSNTAQSGTFKKGGKVSRFDEGGDVTDTSRGGYASFEKAKREEDMPLANSIRNAPGKAYDAIRRLLGSAPEATAEPVKEAGAGRGFINPTPPAGARR